MAELMGAADRDVTRLTTTPTSAQRSGAVQREAATGGSPLRLLMVATRAHPYAGGVETHIAEVGPRLVRSGIDVTLLTTDGVGDLPAAEVTGGVRVLRVRAWSAKPDYALAPGVYRAIIRGSWDVVHCQGFHTPVPPTAMLAARRAGIPYVVSFHSGGHSSSVRHALQRAQLTMLGPLFLAARRLVAVSEFEAELFSQVVARRETLVVGGKPAVKRSPCHDVAGRDIIPPAHEQGCRLARRQHEPFTERLLQALNLRPSVVEHEARGRDGHQRAGRVVEQPDHLAQVVRLPPVVRVEDRDVLGVRLRHEQVGVGDVTHILFSAHQPHPRVPDRNDNVRGAVLRRVVTDD